MPDNEVKEMIKKARNALTAKLELAKKNVTEAVDNQSTAINNYSKRHDEARAKEVFVPSSEHDQLRLAISETTDELASALIARDEALDEHNQYFRPL